MHLSKSDFCHLFNYNDELIQFWSEIEQAIRKPKKYNNHHPNIVNHHWIVFCELFLCKKLSWWKIFPNSMDCNSELHCLKMRVHILIQCFTKFNQLSIVGQPWLENLNSDLIYPFFALAIFLPFGLIKSLVVARAAWMLVLELMVILIYWFSINLGNWKPKLRTNILLFSFFATFYHTLRAVIDGNLIVLTTLY